MYNLIMVGDRMKKLINNNIKLLIGIVVGIIINGVVVYATIAASSITYNGTTVDQALDDLYSRVNESLERGKYQNYWNITSASIPYGVDQSSTVVVNSADVSAVVPYQVRVYGINSLYNDSGTVIYEKTSGGWGEQVSLESYQSQYKYFVFVNLFTQGYGYSLVN